MINTKNFSEINNINKKNIFEYLNKINDKIINHRRTIHKNPELSCSEYETCDYICKVLDEIGVTYVKGIFNTGVVATIYGSAESDNPKTVLLRADMDALPVVEANETPYKSQTPGVMHACGHDAHTAVLLGVCEVLNKFKHCFSGCVKLVFQPAEETVGGAFPMIESGILDNPNVDCCLALHVDSDIEKGKIRIKKGSLYASPDDFKIMVKGRGGHGAEPHRCVDPVMISAHIVTALNSMVSREINPFDNAVVTVGSIHSGTATNIIPDFAEIKGTARSLTNEVREFIKRRIGEVANGICDTFSAECEYEYSELFPPLINNNEICDMLTNSAKEILGEENCILGGSATMAGEDFAYFTQVCPSVLFKLGCRNEEKGIINPIHHSAFDIDEDCLVCGAAVFTNFILDYLE